MNEALACILGALIGAIVSLIIGLLTHRRSCKQIFAEVVSQNRMDWINRFRDEVSTIVATLKYLAIIQKEKNSFLTNEDKEKFFNAEKAKSSLLTRLNHNNNAGNEFCSVFTELLNLINFENLTAGDEIIVQLQILTKKVLEPEWQKVKKEAKGGK